MCNILINDVFAGFHFNMIILFIITSSSSSSSSSSPSYYEYNRSTSENSKFLINYPLEIYFRTE